MLTTGVAWCGGVLRRTVCLTSPVSTTHHADSPSRPLKASQGPADAVRTGQTVPYPMAGEDTVDDAELLMSEAYSQGTVTEVIRPAAIVPEHAARAILVELAMRDVRNNGLWQSEPSLWSRYDRPWSGTTNTTGAEMIGSIQLAYGTPSRYEITLYRVTVTKFGSDHGWTVATLCDEALAYGDLSLDQCPRARLATPPPVVRI